MPAHPQGMTITSRTDQHRQPAGVPVGGQFATAVRTEPDIVLDPSATSHADEAILELSERELLAAARQSVRTHAFKQGVRFVGEDDMVQDTVAEVLASKRRNGQVVVTRPYVNAVGANIVAQAARGTLRQEDRKAIGIFNRKVAELQAEMGRGLTGAEKDQLAAQIRNDWHDPRHRPSADFVALAAVRRLSLDAPVSSRQPTCTSLTLGDSLAETGFGATALGSDDLSVEPGTLAAAVLSGEANDKVKNQGNAWNILASVSGAPEAVEHSVTPRNATAARVKIGDAGGVTATARSWLNGETSPATDALFAPFGGPDEGGRDEIAQTLIARGAYAELLWNSALVTASRRRG